MVIRTLLGLILTISGMSFHPIHVSVCEMEYDANDRAIETVITIFIDDLEKSVRAQVKDPEFDITAPHNGQTTDEILEAYLKKHLLVKVNGKQPEAEYLGHERDIDAFRCYVQYIKVKKIKSLQVTNTILHRLHEDQENFVHLDYKGEIRSLKLTNKKQTDTLSYQ